MHNLLCSLYKTLLNQDVEINERDLPVKIGKLKNT